MLVGQRHVNQATSVREQLSSVMSMYNKAGKPENQPKKPMVGYYGVLTPHEKPKKKLLKKCNQQPVRPWE